MPGTGSQARLTPPRDRLALLTLHAGVVVALAVWVRTLALPAGLFGATGEFALAFVSWYAGRRVLSAALVATALTVGVLAPGMVRVGDTSSHDRAAVAARATTLEESVVSAANEVQRRLTTTAVLVAAGAQPGEALPELESDAGVIVYAGDSALAWAGRTVVPTGSLWERNGVVVTPFYVVQYAVAVHGNRRAVATSVLAARPPADRLSRALVSNIGARERARFDVLPSVVAPLGGARLEVGGARLAINAFPQDPAAFAAQQEQHSRSLAAALLFVATLLALAALWRRAGRAPERILVAAIPLAAIAIAPLNALSNVTRLFDPATYYDDLGGPFTASIGALGLTSAFVLFAVMEAVRVRPRPRRRWAAALLALFVVGVGPFLLRHLSRGVNLPPGGTETGLWLAWEIALFLAATSLLIVGVSAGQRVLGAGRRGVPVWVAPALAAAAALLGPLLLGDAAAWPDWYPFLWIGAIAALVLARPSRAVLLSTAMVAACGATVLLWGSTLRERVDMATSDVASLASVDAGATALLERFTADLQAADVPATREELLARYASADLAAADYAVVLGHWPADSAATLLSLGGDGRLADVGPVVDEARRTGHPLLTHLVPNPSAAEVLAVPHPSGDVTTVVVGARTRLLPAHDFVELLGLSPAPARPPYELSKVTPATPADSARVPWRRLATHLHSEWHVPSGPKESARVIADVTFDAYDTLLAHGLLVVLFDLFIVLTLGMGGLLADGALGRWVRMRSAEWRRSYRLQLTLALFAFFVVPALAFALWSYSRLQADDRSARELVVRETLRRAEVRDSTVNTPQPVIDHVPTDVPLLTYRSGQLVAARDTLHMSLAPIGLWIHPEVQRSLANADELVATSTASVGERQMLFGFRALEPGIVAAVPARRDDLALDKRRNDLGVLVILATVLGALAALWLSGVAARRLATPIGTLRSAALAVAGGSREPLRADNAPAEFVPVFRAFDRMSRDLAASEAQLSRAERVLAWGEMARQVAHEIKNPLTPIRLGVQHVQRAWNDRRSDFGTILEENAARVLNAIDHLDATARSFSRYGTPPEEPTSIEPIDVAAVVRDVAALEALGDDALSWRTRGADAPRYARARSTELREVLLNLCDNARNAGAHTVELALDKRDGHVILSVTDDGEGVPRQLHSRVFEPHFSTRTSGSGLGLAISRRLVEAWGASISLESEPGRGSTIRLQLDE